MTRVFRGQDMAKESLVKKCVDRSPKSTNRIQKTISSLMKPNVYTPFKTVLNTTRKYTERQQPISLYDLNLRKACNDFIVDVSRATEDLFKVLRPSLQDLPLLSAVGSHIHIREEPENCSS